MRVSRRDLLGALAAAAAAACGCASRVPRAKTEGKAMADGDKLLKEWWACPGLDASGKTVWDAEVKAVNAMMPPVGDIPDWAVALRGAMPRYGFEMCGHRWLDGLDDVLGMMGEEKAWRTTAGRCGDVPGWAFDAAELRVKAVECWLDGKAPPHVASSPPVAEWLGEPTPEKKEAATCFVELTRAHCFSFGADEQPRTLAKKWRARREQSKLLGEMFQGDGLDGVLQNDCGFKTIDSLDVFLQLIGGDRSRAGERHAVCNGQLRFVFRDDPARYDTTRGYCWGLDAYLRGQDAAWLRTNKPACAGAAIYALTAVSRPGKPTPLRRWLAASMLKATKIWCQAVLNRLKDKAPAYARDLPDVVAAARA